MVCSMKERAAQKFPFDIQHRAVIIYESDSPSDFQKLRERITERLRAALKKRSDVEQLAASPLVGTQGLNSHEMTCLTLVLENSQFVGETVWSRAIDNDMARAGFTKVATRIALRTLVQKQMLEAVMESDRDGDPVQTYRMLVHGQDWLIANQDKLQMRVPVTPEGKDDIPF
jgi:hypothetical protein